MYARYACTRTYVTDTYRVNIKTSPSLHVFVDMSAMSEICVKFTQLLSIQTYLLHHHVWLKYIEKLQNYAVSLHRRSQDFCWGGALYCWLKHWRPFLVDILRTQEMPPKFNAAPSSAPKCYSSFKGRGHSRSRGALTT